MNSVPNSDSEQCIESKLSRVHSAPTLGPACAHTALCGKPSMAMSQAWPGRVAGLAQPCHRLGPAMSQRPLKRWRAVSQVMCCASCRTLYRHARRHVARPLRRIVTPPPVVSRLSRDTTQQPNRALVTIRPFISRHNPPAARPSRTRRSPLCRGRPCSMGLSAVSQAESSALSWPNPTVSWPYRGHGCYALPAVSRYNALYRDQS